MSGDAATFPAEIGKAPPRVQVSSPAEAAAKLQRWYRAYARKRRFLTVVNRARRKRHYLDQRRRLAQRVHEAETEADDLKSKIALPGGARLVNRWRGARESEASQKVQSVCRRFLAKHKFCKLVYENRKERAVTMLQGCIRRRQQRQRPSLASRAEKETPWSRPIDQGQLLQHEERVLQKRKEYHASMRQGMNDEALKKRAAEQYRGLLEGLGQRRYDIWRTILVREQTRQMIQTLEGKNWDRPPPYGVCSATLIEDAEEKHKEIKASLMREMVIDTQTLSSTSLSGTAQGEPVDVPAALESRTEEAEADSLLLKLETSLGYNFSLAGESM